MRYFQKQQGFTLIEIMVSLSIFSIVMVIALGTLLTLVRVSAVAQNSQTVTNNLSFAIDSMSRKIRTGFDYRCVSLNLVDDTDSLPQGTADCSDSDFVFSDGRNGDRVGYRLSAGRIQQKTDERSGGSFTPGPWLDLTSPNVTIQSFEFVVDGSTAGDVTQPTVVILIDGVTGLAGEEADFTIQTMVISRSIDL